MDSLPVELLHFIYQYCDTPTVKSLRLVSGKLAEVGYDYLLQPHLTAVEWRDDVERLHNIASHERLRKRIQHITFNFSKVNEYEARHASFFQNWVQEPEERNAVLQDAWDTYYELEEQSRKLPALHTRSDSVEDSFKQLPALRELEITYTKCPYDIEVLQHVFNVPKCRRRDQKDRARACKNLNAIVSAVRYVQLDALTIDQLPLEIFRLPDDRRHWFDCARSFASLSRLDLVLDVPANFMPQSRSRTINALGHVLQFCPNLTHLSLAFHSYHAPLEKFGLLFHALFGPEFRFERLTDLKLEGITCAEDDLRGFLLRHADTLERLRLGGRGLAEPFENGIGGVHLHNGSWRSLFVSLRGKLPRLQRFHMEGDVEAGDIMTSSRELYKFHAITNDNWEEIPWSVTASRRNSASSSRSSGRSTRSSSASARWSAHQLPETVDCLALERYLIHGGEFPKFTPTAITDAVASLSLGPVAFAAPSIAMSMATSATAAVASE